MFGQAGTLLNPKAGFSPLGIPGLRLWLAANQSPFTLNSGKASQWNDLSGFGNHATQATATLQPVLTRADGLQNLQVWSQDFSQSPWALSNTITKTDNFATDPNGGMTAAKLEITTGWMDAGLNTYIQNSNDVSLAFYVKKAASGAATHTRLTTNDNAAWNTGISTKLALTDSWQRISFSGDALPSSAETGVRVILGCIDETSAVDSDCVGDILVAFASINDGTTLGDYAATGAVPGYPGVNGLPAIRPDNVDDYLELSASVNSSLFFETNQKTFFVVWQYIGETEAGVNRLLTGITSGGATAWGFYSVAGVQSARYRKNDDATITHSFTGTASNPTTFILATRHDGASCRFYRNSLTADGTVADARTTADSTTSAGRVGNATGGNYSEVIDCDVALTDAEFNRTMNYLANKYGVTLS